VLKAKLKHNNGGGCGPSNHHPLLNGKNAQRELEVEAHLTAQTFRRGGTLGGYLSERGAKGIQENETSGRTKRAARTSEQNK